MLTSLLSLKQGNVKKSEKLMKTVNIEENHLHIFWTTWGISIKFSEKIWLKIILKVTKKQGIILCLKNAFLEIWQKGGGQTDPPGLFRVKEIIWNLYLNLGWINTEKKSFLGAVLGQPCCSSSFKTGLGLKLSTENYVRFLSNI